MKIVTWNVGGMHSDREKLIKVLRKCRDQKADLIVLQEIVRVANPDSVPNMDDKIDQLRTSMDLLWQQGDFIVTPHIAVLSPYRHSLKLVASHLQSRVVDFVYSHVARGDRKIHVPYFAMNFRAMYAPADNLGSVKRTFWTSLPPPLPMSWLLGDLNTPMSGADTRSGTTKGYSFFDSIREYINDLELIDTHKAIKGQYAEHTHHRPNASSRLDYIFAPPTLLSPHASAHVIPPGTLSEHSLVILENRKRTG